VRYRHPVPDLVRGRLDPPEAAPPNGEQFRRLARVGGTEIEQILSGALDGPADFLQAHDEWVVVLAGGAELDVDGTACTLTAGDWIVLPAGVPHRVVRCEPGTSWLAVHAKAASGDQP
jgi:hypothetical protein